MMAYIDPVKKVRELAKVDPLVRVCAEDYYVRQLKILQKMFNEHGYTLVARITNDVDIPSAE